MIEADQVFVKSSSRDAVMASLREVVESGGFEMSSDQLPLPERYTTADRKKTRHFYVSQPTEGWVCILESKSGDAALAQRLSAALKTEAVWLSFSQRANQMSYTVIASGDVVKDEMVRPVAGKKRFSWFTPQSGDDLVEKGQEVYRDLGLPWPFYGYEQVDHSPNKEEYFSHMNFGRIDTAT